MSKYNIKITQSAENDLLEIGKYIPKELLEPEIATKVVSKISKSILQLQEMPLRNRLVKDNRLASQRIRKIIVDNYIVFYIVNQELKTVTIIRILYIRRYWMNLL